MNKKSLLKSKTFWASILTAVVGVASGAGVLTPEQTQALTALGTACIGVFLRDAIRTEV